MPINGVGVNTSPRTTRTDDTKKTTADQKPSNSAAPASDTLTMDSFMRLLAVQFRNQDMNNPMSNAEMMGQLTSMATVQAMNTFTELSTTQYALSMIGQKVQVVYPKGKDDEGKEQSGLDKKVGIVTGIDLSAMLIYLDDSERGYTIGNIMQVGTVPEPKPDDPNKPGDGGDGGDGDDENNGPQANQQNQNTRSAMSRTTAMDKTIPQDKAEALANTGYMPEDKRAAIESRNLSSDDKTSPYRRPVTGPGAAI